MSRRLHIVLPWLATLVVAGQAALAEPVLTVTGLELVRTRRLSVVAYEYTYRVTGRNSGTDALSVTADLVVLPVGVTATDGRAVFGDVAGGTSSRSTDTIVLRHDRRFGSFSARLLGWRFAFVDAVAARLQGDPASPALSALRDYVEEGLPYTDAQVSTNASGQRIVRTSLAVTLRPDATIGQVNQALDGIGARISASLAGRRDIGVAFADPGSLAALEARAAQLRLQPGIQTVALAVIPDLDVLPPSPALTPPVTVRPIQHHLAIRAHAAWNLLGLLDRADLRSRRPVFILHDKFGYGPPSTTQFGVNVLMPSDFSTVTDASDHGYSVLSVIAAKLPRAGTSDAALVTGLLPVDDLPVRVVDAAAVKDADTYVKLVQMIKGQRAAGRNVIVNESLGRCGSDPCLPAETLKAHEDAQRLIRLVRGEYFFQDDLSDDFLMFSSAGNNPANAPWDNSGPGRAAVNPQVALGVYHDATTLTVRDPATGAPVTDLFGNDEELQKLPNLSSVEARFNFAAAPSGLPAGQRDSIPPVPNCLAAYSAVGGHVSAIGGQTPVVVVAGQVVVDKALGMLVSNGPNATYGAEYAAGTSLSSPQAAAVAGWIWSLRPDLPAGQVLRLLRATSKPASSLTPCDVRDTSAQPVVDVYSAALATDNPYFDDPAQSVDLGRSAVAPARLWLLDVASVDAGGQLVEDVPDGKFTQADLLKFLKEFEARKGATDYSRYDLNGNATTGEAPDPRTDVGFISRFDLDGDLTWASADQVIEGATVALDEANNDVGPSDLAVLVYYAYSPLYTGNAYERTLLLAPYLQRFNAPALYLDGLDVVAGPGQQTIQVRGLGDEPTDSVFTSLCAIGGARGTPLWSAEPVAAALATGPGREPVFWRPTAQFNRIADEPSNVTNCSSFVAALPGTGRWWINIASRTRSTSPTPADNEYQLRIYLGEPDLAAGPDPVFQPPPGRVQTQTVEYGRVLSGVLDPVDPIPFVPDAGFPNTFRVSAFRFRPGQ
jgi:hypothetical protein